MDTGETLIVNNSEVLRGTSARRAGIVHEPLRMLPYKWRCPSIMDTGETMIVNNSEVL